MRTRTKTLYIYIYIGYISVYLLINIQLILGMSKILAIIPSNKVARAVPYGRDCPTKSKKKRPTRVRTLRTSKKDKIFIVGGLSQPDLP